MKAIEQIALQGIRRTKLLLVVNADTKGRTGRVLDRSRERLTDYAALQSQLHGDILDWNDLKAHRWSRLMSKVAGKGATLATLAFLRRRSYNFFYCDSENNGLVLALLLKLSRQHIPLVMIGHWITPPKKAVLFKRLRLHSHITTLFLHSTHQYHQAIEQLGFKPHQLQLLPYQVDTEFWHPRHASIKGDTPPYICTAGLEYRDYPTLIEAVRDLPISLKIGAASSWSKRKNTAAALQLPPNVTMRPYTYHELRDLYAASRFVVVPLFDTDFQAGITLILEAMAMGKAVITTRSLGQGDTIVDARDALRNWSEDLRPTGGKFTSLFGGTDIEGVNGATGLYVAPGRPDELRQAIKYLIDNPEKAEAMGRRGRRTVESMMRVEHFAARIKRTVTENIAALNPSATDFSFTPRRKEN